MQDNAQRMKWACRRGMLELDLFLVPFFEHAFHDLNDEDKVTFKQLLSQTDPTLFSWLMGKEHPDTSELKSLVKKIRDYRLCGNRSLF